jgi:hypothetical protein
VFLKYGRTMKKLKKYVPLLEDDPFKYSAIKFKDLNEFADWLKTLNVPKRKPKNINKVEHENLLRAIDILNNPDYKDNLEFRNSLLKNVAAGIRVTKDELEKVYSSKTDQPSKVEGKYATYVKNDTGSYSRFLSNIQNIESFLSTLKGYHKKALKNLVVEFVSSKEMKVPAKWKSREKVIWINPLSKKVGKTFEEYGSLRYIVLHELGHKFLKEYPQKWNISDPTLYTTDYSKKNPQTFTEEEVFAELFALSNWKNKYPKYKEQIAEFEKRLK